MADSLPLPGPLTLTSTSRMPNFWAFSAQTSAARCAAKGVLFRLPLNPTVPAEAQVNTSPFRSVTVTMVLLKLLWMWIIPWVTFRRVRFFFALATVPASSLLERTVRTQTISIFRSR